MRTLVAGVGYSHLSDLSLGPVLAERLGKEAWPAHIDVDDLSYGPVAVVQRLEETTPPYDRLVFVAAVDRGLPPGSLRCYRWDGALPSPDEIQARVGEAVTGVVSLDNLLIVAQQFTALPAAVFVVEMQPELMDFGLTFSDTVGGQVDRVARLARTLAEDDDTAARCPVATLGGLTSAS